MIYLYAGLGTAMLTAIMLIFEIGLALTDQSLLFSDKIKNMRQKHTVQAYDLLFLQMLSRSDDLSAIGTGLFGRSLCSQIMCRINGIGCRIGNSKSSNYQSLQNYGSKVFSPPLGLWSSACVLERPLASSNSVHRVLIRTDQNSTRTSYQLFSCVLKSTEVDRRCLFERSS